MKKMIIGYTMVAALLLLWSTTSYAEPFADLPDGSKLDLGAICPICHMKIEASMIGPAAIVMKDGTVKGFDAAGDLLRYYLEPKAHDLDIDKIKDIYVTEYGTRKFINGKKAFYVTGSDLQQGMGPELAPFANKEDAEKWKAQHSGSGVVDFNKVTLNDLKAKKKRMKMDHGH